MPNRDNKTIRVSCRISQPDFILLEAVAKRGGYATLSELIRDALIHMTHAVIDRTIRPSRTTAVNHSSSGRSTELMPPQPYDPNPLTAAYATSAPKESYPIDRPEGYPIAGPEGYAGGSVEMDIRAIFEDAQSLGSDFEDDMRKRNSK